MKILGLGDNVFDVYRNLKVSYPGGNAVNVAVNGAKLGVESAYLGNLADDHYGYDMQAVLQSCHVDIDHCRIIKDSSTKLCLEDVIDGERQFIKVDLGENWAGVIELTESDLMYIQDFDVVLTSCNAKMEDQICQLKDFQGIVSYDFGEKEKYRCEDYFQKICPYVDLMQFSMNHASIDDIQEMIDQYALQAPILITRGSGGPLFYTGSEYIEGVMDYVEPVDTMGAGDAYITAFVYSLVKQGWTKKGQLKKEWIIYAMKEAAAYAKSVCLIEGGFGYPYQKKELKAVIFDMDGVIVDSEAHWQDIFEGIVQQYGKTLTDADKREFYGCSLEKEIDILSRYISKDADAIAKIRMAYSQAHPICYNEHIMDGVIDLIRYLKSNHIRLVIASSSLLKDIQKMLKECGLMDMFDFIVSGEMFKESKPNPEIYHHTVQMLDIPKENIYVIEDSQYGVEAAYRAGLEVLALRNQDYEFDLSQAKIEFDSHKDILKYMKKVVLRRNK